MSPQCLSEVMSNAHLGAFLIIAMNKIAAWGGPSALESSPGGL